MPGRKPETGATAGADRSGRAGAGTKDRAEDLVQFIVAYVKQETLDPVVKQVKALAKGVAGAALLALGTVLLSLGFLRALQAEFGSTGTSSAVVVSSVARQSTVVRARFGPYGPYGTGTHLSGDWSWVPYMGGALFALLIAGFCVTRITKGTSR